jgi:hypothetical protein
VEPRQRLLPIITALRRSVFTRENLWALALALALLVTITCATTGVQPTFIYTGF